MARRNFRILNKEFDFNKPSKTIKYKGLTIDLWDAGVYRSILRKSYGRHVSYMQKGILCRPIFKANGRGYYTIFEIAILMEAKRRFGIPSRVNNKNVGCFNFINTETEKAKNLIEQGKEPPFPIFLFYKDRREFEAELYSAFSEFVKNRALIRKVVSGIISKEINSKNQ